MVLKAYFLSTLVSVAVLAVSASPIPDEKSIALSGQGLLTNSKISSSNFDITKKKNKKPKPPKQKTGPQPKPIRPPGQRPAPPPPHQPPHQPPRQPSPPPHH